MLFYEEPSEFELASKYIQEQCYNATCSLNESIKPIKTRNDMKKQTNKFKANLKLIKGAPKTYDKNVTMAGYLYPVPLTPLISDMNGVIDIGNTIIKACTSKNGSNIKSLYKTLSTICNEYLKIDELIKTCLTTTSNYHLSFKDCQHGVQDLHNKVLNWYRTGHASIELEEKQEITFNLDKYSVGSYPANVLLLDQACNAAEKIIDQTNLYKNIINKLKDIYGNFKTDSDEAKTMITYSQMSTIAIKIADDIASVTMDVVQESIHQYDAIMAQYKKNNNIKD